MECPKHNVELKRKKIVYGYPDPNFDYSGFILGGCCVEGNEPHDGYQCPIDKAVFYLKNGKLLTTEEYEQERAIDSE